jgi:hypothetical protein
MPRGRTPTWPVPPPRSPKHLDNDSQPEVVERRKSHRQGGRSNARYNRIWKRSCGKQRRSLRTIEQPSDLWELERYLTERRKEIDRQYDYRYSVLLSVFADLIQKGRLREQDLQGLSAEKLRHIHHMAQAGRPLVESAKSLGKPSPPLQPPFGLGSQRRSEYPPESRSS